MAHAAQPAAPLSRAPAPPSRDRRPDWSERAVGVVERRWPWALGALMLIDLAWLLYMGRGLTFFYDEWDFVQHDYGGGIHSLLAAHVGNIALFPVVVYKILFHLVGLNHYAVFRLVVILLHLTSAGLIFVLASRRVDRAPALLATALILFLGAAWEDLLWAFQVGYLLSIATGLAIWLLLEREDRPGDIAAALCLVVSVGSSSLGIAIAIGVAVELAWRRQWRRGWIVALPAVLYLLWYLGYGESQVTKEELINAPGYVEDLAASAFGGLIGRGLDWGRPLALVGALVLLRRFIRPLPVSPRLAGLVATALSLWIITAAARSTISPPESSRYIYLGAVAIVLVGVEMLRGVTIGPQVLALAAVLVAYFAVTGLTLMHAGANGLRGTSKTLAAELGALELASAKAPPNYHPDPQRAPTIEAGPYLHTVRAIGSSPADDPAQIAAADPGSRAAADAVLFALEAPTLRSAAGARLSPEARPPEVEALTAGNQTQRGNCLRFTPLGPQASLALRARPGAQLLIQAGRGAAVGVTLRRFAEVIGAHAIGTLPAAASSALLSLPLDRARTRPWRVALSAAQPIEVCSQ